MNQNSQTFSTVRNWLTIFCSLTASCTALAQNQLELGTPKIITSINHDVWSPVPSSDQLELYYTYRVSDTDWDIYYATRDEITDAWAVEGSVEALDSPAREDDLALSGDGLTMIFGSTREGGLGGSDLWLSQRTAIGSPWQPPTNLEVLNSNLDEGSPSLSSDGLSLYFAGAVFNSTLPKVSTRLSIDDAWSTPSTVSGFEQIAVSYPAITADGLSMLYDRGQDLWIASRESIDEPFGGHSQLPSEFNTGGADSMPHLTEDGILYHVRDAGPGGSRGFRLWHTGPELVFDPLDFNSDGRSGLVDIDRLCADVSRGDFEAEQDLNSDGVLDQTDVNIFLERTGSLPGDLDYDGDVDFTDFLAFSDSLGRGRGRWSSGDFDCDRETGFSDFLLFADNFGFGVLSEVENQPVPEPKSVSSFCLPLLLILLLGRPSNRSIKR